ncbi:MAG: hypothetical protein ACRDJM_07295 [Actinomycetota bacterium]
MRVKRTVAMAVLAGAVGLFGGGAALARDAGVHTGACARLAPNASQWNYRLVAVMQQVPVQELCSDENALTQQLEELLQDVDAAFNANR